MNLREEQKSPIATASERTLLYALKEFGHLGPKTMIGLLAHFKSAAALMNADSAEILAIPNIGDKTVEAITEAIRGIGRAEDDLTKCTENGVAVTDITSHDYPRAFARISDPPMLLYRKGKTPEVGRSRVAIIGTTEPSDTAVHEATDWGRVLAENGCIMVSGLARGIDGAAHRGCLIAEGFNVAVLGCGFHEIYPPEHQSLAAEITETGCLLSEYRPDMTVTKTRLILRNRLVAAMADAIVIVQLSDETRGSQETARRATEMGKPIFLSTTHLNAEGKRMLAEGAYPVDTPDDLPFVLKLSRF